MNYFIGINLHSTSSYVGVIDRKVFSKKFPNELDSIVQALEPFRSTAAGIVVESTYNWYWLVDGPTEKGYRVHLANPSAIKQYEGLKHTDDVTGAFHLANLLRLGILPEGYIYPKAGRPVRDMLRKTPASGAAAHRTNTECAKSADAESGNTDECTGSKKAQRLGCRAAVC